MNKKTHEAAGKLIINHFGYPESQGLINWAVLPDKKYNHESFFKFVVLHRLSLHGPENLAAAIRVGKESDFVEYSERAHWLSECLLMSHNYLDLFNFVIPPSWPDNYRFCWIPEQLHYFFTFHTLRDPDGAVELMGEMANSCSSPKELTALMLKEYKQLPTVGVWMRRFLTLYDKGDKNVEEFSD